MILHRKLVMIKFWIKNLKLNNDSLVKKTCNMLNADTYLGHSYNGLNWTSNIKHILDEIGMSYLWIQHNGLDIKFAPIKQRIIDTYKQDWHSAINNSGRLMTYCNFKEENKLEKYLSCIQTKRFRIALTKLRLSSHDLAI